MQSSRRRLIHSKLIVPGNFPIPTAFWHREANPPVPETIGLHDENANSVYVSVQELKALVDHVWTHAFPGISHHKILLLVTHSLAQLQPFREKFAILRICP